MKLDIKYDHQDGSGNVTTLPADIIRWERMTKQKLAGLSDNNVGMEDVAIFTWSVLHRTHQTNAPFEVWLDGLLDVEILDTDEVNPTQAEASNTNA